MATIPASKKASKKGILEFPAGIPDVSPSQANKDIKRFKGASLSRAVSSLRLAVDALMAARFRDAVRRSITAAMDAAIAHRENPLLAARIIRGARRVAARAADHMRSMTLQRKSIMPAPEAAVASLFQNTSDTPSIEELMVAAKALEA